MAGSAAPRTWPNGDAAVLRRKFSTSAVMNLAGQHIGDAGWVGRERVGRDPADCLIGGHQFGGGEVRLPQGHRRGPGVGQADERGVGRALVG